MRTCWYTLPPLDQIVEKYVFNQSFRGFFKLRLKESYNSAQIITNNFLQDIEEIKTIDSRISRTTSAPIITIKQNLVWKYFQFTVFLDIFKKLTGLLRRKFNNWLIWNSYEVIF